VTPKQETQLIENVTKITQAVMGNGVKGLAQRVDDIEEWRHSHPRLCPFEKKQSEIWGVRVGEAAVIGIALTCGEIILRLLHVL
jgi:hypothetical protein